MLNETGNEVSLFVERLQRESTRNREGPCA